MLCQFWFVVAQSGHTGSLWLARPMKNARVAKPHCTGVFTHRHGATRASGASLRCFPAAPVIILCYVATTKQY
ncbi:hypothetical protein CWS02_07865 [Enterobacter sp. EA-1]|nr:hypothetical protein CWS02_07865 [Enterobacter sp. EA-1]